MAFNQLNPYIGGGVPDGWNNQLLGRSPMDRVRLIGRSWGRPKNMLGGAMSGSSTGASAISGSGGAGAEQQVSFRPLPGGGGGSKF